MEPTAQHLKVKMVVMWTLFAIAATTFVVLFFSGIVLMAHGNSHGEELFLGGLFGAEPATTGLGYIAIGVSMKYKKAKSATSEMALSP